MNRQNQLNLLAKNLKVRSGIHSGSGPERLESHLMKSDNKANWNMLRNLAPESLDSIRFLTLFGRLKTQIRKAEDPDERFIMANGGYVGKKYNIPKLETGINSVPVDMLAQLHKNEAVIPANMNPFNPNANNATMGGATYNITNNINGYDGDLNQLSNMVTQKTITAITAIDKMNSKMVGTART
jgi:hypothetical protein